MKDSQKRYLLYIDILGFNQLVQEKPQRIKTLYRIINSLNVHTHDVFRTIVFSDTILVYNRDNANNINDHKYLVMYACEFVQDLQYRLIGQDIYFRAVLVAGDFDHYTLENIECFYGKALIDAYLNEKGIQAVGLFIDDNCNKYNGIFPTARYDNKLNFVFLNQSLERLQRNSKGELPIDPFLLNETDEYWDILWDFRLLNGIYDLMSNHPDPRVRGKHLATWNFFQQRYPNIMRVLESGEFDPKVLCNQYDWSTMKAQLERDIQHFRNL